MQVRVCVIGAGPAGLACGAALSELGVDHVVLEAGAADREGEFLTGLGGAGLYSDGKFSFRPAASNLWELRPVEHLSDASQWVRGLLDAHGVSTADLLQHASPTARGPATFKHYPSFYVSEGARAALVSEMAAAANVALESRVTSIDRRGTVRGWELEIADGRRLEADILVLGAGRLWNSLLTRTNGIQVKAGRVELGVRIEQPSEEFVFKSRDSLDPKWIVRPRPGVEYRTFCCCRDGAIVAGKIGGSTLLSGRADCPPTGRSNVGLVVRYLQPSSESYQALDRAMSHSVAFEIGARDASRAFDALSAQFSVKVARDLQQALTMLASDTSTDFQNAVLHGPCVEGIGWYPEVDSHSLEFAGGHGFAVGDATGLFRGIVAGLISGRVAALAIAQRVGKI